MNRIYLDNAASTPMDPEVFEYMTPYLKDFYGNPSSVHDHGRKLRAIIERSRKEIASSLGAAPAEIVFTSGGTEADNMAIKGAVNGLGVKHIVSTRIEHHAVLHPIEGYEKQGFPVTWLNVDSKGRPDLDQLNEVLTKHPNSLVSIMHANNELGTLVDLHAIGNICRAHGALFHSDTVQSMGQLKYNLSETPVDFITASAHKFYGPKGVGFLYVRSGIQLPSLLCGGSQERNVRAGTENVACIAGMSFALNKCYGMLESKSKHLLSLKNYLKAELEKRFPGIGFNGATGDQESIPTVLNVAFPSGNDSMLLFNLDIAGISASGGSACTSGSLNTSHVLEGIGLPSSKAQNSIRFSFGIQNSKVELDVLLTKLDAIVQVTA